jgi:hypothetical protein
VLHSSSIFFSKARLEESLILKALTDKCFISGVNQHARYMANAIYLLKIQSLSEEFAMSIEERKNVKRVANFTAMFYVKMFLRSRLASVAPSDDLKFLSLMKLFSDEDEIAVKSCTKSVLSH